MIYCTCPDSLLQYPDTLGAEPFSFKSRPGYVDGFVQDGSNSVANALESLQSCIKHRYNYITQKAHGMYHPNFREILPLRYDSLRRKEPAFLDVINCAIQKLVGNFNYSGSLSEFELSVSIQPVGTYMHLH